MSLLDIAFQAALQHHQAGRLSDAETGYRRVLAADPGHADSLHLLGVIAAQCGHLDAAVDLIGHAVAARGDIAAYHVNLGLAEQGRGRAEAAEACYRRALALEPGNADAHNNLGILLQNRGEPGAAAEAFERCLAARPDHPDAPINLCLALRNLGRIDEAVACGKRAVAARPESPEALSNLGLALDNAGEAAVAIDYFRRAIALRPDYVEAMNNLGLALQSTGQDEAALALFAEVLARQPQNAKARLSAGMIRLLTGDFAQGWADYEARWAELEARDRGIPRWDGSEGAGRSILVWQEQGLGDTLQFCRYVPLLAARGWRVTLDVQKPLLRLLGRLEGAVAVTEGTGLEARDFDAQCPLVGLPLHFGTRLDSIPAALPYLSADPDDSARWARRLAEAGLPAAGQALRVGLVWAGNSYRGSPFLTLADRRRSIALDRLAPVLAVPGIAFVSLQKELKPGDDPAASGLIDVMEEVRDFADTAAIVAALDLVIAVDTSTLHLAAAMGKPVWLLNRFDTCWRWLRGRDDSPWYPALRQFRQPAPGDWDSAIAVVAAALQDVSPAIS